MSDTQKFILVAAAALLIGFVTVGGFETRRPQVTLLPTIGACGCAECNCENCTCDKCKCGRCHKASCPRCPKCGGEIQ